MIIAITGNIGSGKSTAGAFFKKMGYQVISADKVGHSLYHNTNIKKRVVQTFGKDILTQGKIDRAKLKRIVFSNPTKLKELNAIMHPEILNEIIRRIKLKKVIIEGALLIEAGFHWFDTLLLITIDPKEQVKRVLARGKYNKREVLNIIKSQMPQEKKLAFADIIIDNSGTRTEFEENLRKAFI